MSPVPIGRRILRERVVYARPTMVTWYNKYMGGVDLMDHLKADMPACWFSIQLLNSHRSYEWF